jgi:hypothetical protein
MPPLRLRQPLSYCENTEPPPKEPDERGPDLSIRYIATISKIVRESQFKDRTWSLVKNPGPQLPQPARSIEAFWTEIEAIKPDIALPAFQRLWRPLDAQSQALVSRFGGFLPQRPRLQGQAQGRPG